jgi:hypothetical protein
MGGLLLNIGFGGGRWAVAMSCHVHGVVDTGAFPYLSALTNLWIHIHVFPRYVGNL